MHPPIVRPRCALGTVLAIALVPVSAPAASLASDDGAQAQAIVAGVDPAALRATIERLVAFGTRHTMSDTVSDTRGIGAARRWVAARFGEISRDCGGCLEIVTPSQTFTGPRLPTATEVVDVLAIQRGGADADRVAIVAGHLDSRNGDVMDATGDAPGANDDASGVAAAIESARVLSRSRFRATIVYAVLSGEEQGLYGGRVLADYAKSRGWRVEGDLNNDIVGNAFGEDGVHDSGTVRVFSEGTKAVETQKQADYRRYHGGENDSPSRNLARYMTRVADEAMTGFQVRMVYRTDRFGRGGDQVPMLEAGFPAVRVTEAHEHYDRQHQNVRVENGRSYGDVVSGVDFGYLAQVTRLNALVLAAMAAAPAPPTNVTVEGAVMHDTTLAWNAVPGAVGYRVWWRDTTAAQWQHHRDVATPKAVLAGLVIDDWAFGVSSVGADGRESPIVYPGDAGAF